MKKPKKTRESIQQKYGTVVTYYIAFKSHTVKTSASKRNVVCSNPTKINALFSFEQRRFYFPDPDLEDLNRNLWICYECSHS